jgi:uncharacterized membrane protein YqgA involved in biofilm formation
VKIKYSVFIIIAYIILGTLLWSGIQHAQKSHPQNQQEQSENAEKLEIQKFNHFKESELLKFEMDYPVEITPVIEHDASITSVYFGEIMVITSAPMTVAEYNSLKSGPHKQDEILISTTTLDHHEASIFKTKHQNDSLSQSIKILLFTNNQLYTMFILDPTHTQKMLQSFKLI